jgi:hypothetical protein
MLEAFSAFYVEWGQRGEAEVIAHVAFPVGTTMLRDMICAQAGRELHGQFPLLDVAAALRIGGFDPRSVEGYNREHGIAVTLDASPHHPLYHAAAAAACWRHLLRMPDPDPDQPDGEPPLPGNIGVWQAVADQASKNMYSGSGK